MKNQVLVVKHPAGWATKRPGAERASFVEKIQADAIAHGRRMAKADGAELTIQGRNGKFRESNSYGSDPFPPQG
jgi:hypothetical protein